MIIIFYSPLVVFFCDVTMYIYAIELHLSHILDECESKLLNAALAAISHHTMSTSQPKKDSNFALWPGP